MEGMGGAAAGPRRCLGSEVAPATPSRTPPQLYHSHSGLHFFLQVDSFLRIVNNRVPCAYCFRHTQTPPSTTKCKMPCTPPTSNLQGGPRLHSDVLMTTLSPLRQELCIANLCNQSIEESRVPRPGPGAASDPR